MLVLGPLRACLLNGTHGLIQASLVPAARNERAILLPGGHKVLLDADLAALYEVQTRVLVQAVQRNLERCPDDFMFL